MRTSTAVESLLSLRGACVQGDWLPPSPTSSTTSEGSAATVSRASGASLSPSPTALDSQRTVGEIERGERSKDIHQEPAGPGIVSIIVWYYLPRLARGVQWTCFGEETALFTC